LARGAALNEWLQQVRTTLLGAEIMVGLKRVGLTDLNFAASRQLIKDVAAAIENHQLGYNYRQANNRCAIC